MAKNVYSFLSVDCSIIGTGGAFTFNGAIAEEGITVEPIEDKVTYTSGLYGEGMFNLVGSTAATVTIRLLKTNPLNANLQNMYNLQNSNVAGVGTNIITIRDNLRGDNITCSSCAFTKQPSITYAKEGGTVEWVLIASKCSPILGTGESEAV